MRTRNLNNTFTSFRLAIALLLCASAVIFIFAPPTHAQMTGRKRPLKGKPHANYSIFWQVTKPGSADTSYIFGTLHLLEKSYVDTMQPVMRALDRSQAVVGEIIADSMLNFESLAGSMMSGSLRKMMKPKDYKLLAAEMERLLGLPVVLLDRFRPIVVYTALLEGLYQKQHPENHKTGIPMDLFFQQWGREHGKTVLALESVKDQEDLLFDSLPVKEQLQDLLDFLHNEKKAIKQMDDMLAAYAAANVEALLDDPNEGLSKKEMSELVDERNAKWLRELPEMMKGRSLFVAVGAGHLVGRTGLVEGLRKLGFQVKPLAWQ